MIIFTHRGIEKPALGHSESGYAAFKDQVSRGYGLEFDPNFIKDEIIIWHDATLKRLTGDTTPLSEKSYADVKNIRFGNADRITTLAEFFALIKHSATIHALHLKGINQTDACVQRLFAALDAHPEIVPKLLVFDVKLEIAKQFRNKYPGIHLAPSIAHEHDILRYNSCVKETLYPLTTAIQHRTVYDWVWLDEWDLINASGNKKLYTKEIFAECRKHGLKISLVTPELHATSPGLYGGEAHADAASEEKLFARMKEIISLKPDAICTDYPEKCRAFAREL